MRLCLALTLAAALAQAQAPVSWDQTGNSLLSGNFNVRQVVYVVGDVEGNLSRKLALSGAIQFDGQGRYTLEGSLSDSQDANSPRAYTFSGTYAIAASGHGWLGSPLSAGAAVYGLVSGGVFIGSSTESGYNDLFIAAQARAGAASPADFQGTFRAAYFDFPGLSARQSRAAWIALQPDGAGRNAGAVPVDGYVAANAAALVRQEIFGFQYTVANSGGQMIFPASPLLPQRLISGEKTFYLSADGNLFFGGSPNGYDLLVGLRPATAPGLFEGLYYQAGINQDASAIEQIGARLDTFYGSLVAVPNPPFAFANSGLILGHQRVSPVFPAAPFDFNYRDTYVTAAPPEHEDAARGSRYAVGAAGFARLGFGIGPRLGIQIALKAPALSGPGVYLNPAGVVNAASSAPFTAGVAPGEFLSLYGTNLAAATAVAPSLPFPTSLGGVEVLVNGRKAPISAVSPGQVSILVPAATGHPIARIQVVNIGTASNAVTSLMSQTSPGVFTVPPGGVGYGAVLRSDYSLLGPDRPARAGDSLSVYLTGLGAVSDPPADGAAAPVSPLSLAVNQVTVTVGSQPALVTFAGLAPTLAGLYQINFEVPEGAGPNDVSLDVAGPDSYTSQAVIPLTAAAALSAVDSGGESSRDRMLRFLRRRSAGIPPTVRFYFDQEQGR